MRPKTTNADLPSGVIRRKRGDWVGYYLSVTKDGKRAEIPLGKSKEEALHNLQSHVDRRPKDEPVDWDLELGRVWNVTRKRATSRSMAFDVSLDDINAMFRNSKGRCALSGIAFCLERKPDQRFRPWLPSIDRLDNGIGYTRGNCRLVCAYVNIAINQFGVGTFLFVSRQIAATLALVEKTGVAEMIEKCGND